MSKVKTLIITGYGINSDYELKECFQRAGSTADMVHISDMISGKIKLSDYDILGFPGGFSFGDHISSGRVFANKFRFNLFNDIKTFLKAKKPVIGICNGFQVLVKMGLLPNIEGKFVQEATLFQNESCRFEDRWVSLSRNRLNKSIWLRDVEHLALPVRHGEGKFFMTDKKLYKKLKDAPLDALYYTDRNFQPTNSYPENPNGSMDAIAGITDPSGLVFGLMPHPEAFMIRENQPQWQTEERIINEKADKRLKDIDGSGMIFFYNAVEYIQSLRK